MMIAKKVADIPGTLGRMSTTLPLFWHLSSASKKERLDASVKLVGALEQFQAEFTPKPFVSASDEEDQNEGTEKSDGLDLLNVQDVSYSIRRLVRGLASPRESSRLGFSVALTELLSRIDTVTCSQILTLIEVSTKHQGSMNGQDERDMLFAQLFGIMAVIRSGLLVRSGSLASSASSSSEASTQGSYIQAITQLITLGDKKSWLRESAWFTISLAIDALEESEVPWKDPALEEALNILFDKDAAWSPEKVALAIKLHGLHPGYSWNQYLSPPFKNPEMLRSENLQTVAQILKESSTENEDGNLSRAPSGSWKPQLHFVWGILLDTLLPGPNSTIRTKGSFQEFFRVVVDESLFSSTSSPERKFWGFQVFQRALKRVDQESMPMLFTKNFMRSWINHLSNRDRYLHKIALQTATEVQTFVQKKPQLGFALISQLTGVHGNQHFDRLTKTKTVETILTSMDTSGIRDYIDFLLSQIDETGNSDKSNIQSVNSRRSWIIEQLCALIRNNSIPRDDHWIQSILDWLTVHGLFIIIKKSSKSPFHALRSPPKPAFSDDLRQSCRSRLLTCLGDLTSQTIVVKSGGKSTKVAGTASDSEFWLSRVLATIQQLESDNKHVQLLAEVNAEEQALRAKALKLASKIRGKVADDNEESAKGAELLLSATTLQNYCAGEQADVDLELLESCIDGVSRIFSESKTKKSRKFTNDSESSEHEPIDVLIDIIIGFLEKSTACMRTIANQVFLLLSGSVKDSTIDLIVTQLERRSSAELLEDDQDQDMEGSEGEDESENEDEDTEEHVEEEETSDESVEDGPNDENSDNEEEDVELRKKIEEALRVNGIEPATGETDDSEDEEFMDDDQMMAIDEQLAQVFRSRTNEKKSGKNVDAQREATHFKIRILDLVDIFLKKQPSSPFVVRLILPLVELFTGTGPDERQLSDKAKGILRSRFSKVKDLPSGPDAEQAIEIFKQVHALARKAHSSNSIAILSHCSVYLGKILVHSNADETLRDSYRDSLKEFITRKNSGLNASFFQDFLRRFPVVGWQLRTDCLDLTSKAVNVYRQSQAFLLLEVLVSQIPAMGDIAQDVAQFMPSLRKAVLDAANNGCTGEISFTTSQMKELFKLGLIAARQTRQSVTPEEMEEIWQPNLWSNLHDTLVNSLRFKASPALHKMCEQLARVSGATLSTSKTRKARDSAPKRKAGNTSESEQLAQPEIAKRKKIKAA